MHGDEAHILKSMIVKWSDTESNVASRIVLTRAAEAD